MGQDPDQLRQQIAHTREEMGETIDALGYKADVPARAKDKVTGTVDRARESVAGTMDSIRGAVTGGTTSVKDAAADRQEVVDEARKAAGVAQQNPLGLALGSVAVGFLAGMALPSSRVEDERIGPMADDVKEHAAEVGQEALQHGQTGRAGSSTNRRRDGQAQRARARRGTPLKRPGARRGSRGGNASHSLNSSQDE
jgi:hypothetical protein